MAENNLISQYEEQSVLTMSRGELIVKLYDEVIKNLRRASLLFNQQNNDAAKKSTERCKNILNYLISILNDQYEVSNNLKRIYFYMIGQIIQANVHNESEYLDKIIPTVQDLRSAWEQADKMTRMAGGKNKGRSL
jgi:flagellar protein FliS